MASTTSQTVHKKRNNEWTSCGVRVVIGTKLKSWNELNTKRDQICKRCFDVKKLIEIENKVAVIVAGWQA